MNTQVIITKKAGHDIPRGFLQTILKECPTYHGIATQDKVDDAPILETIAENKTADLDELMKTLAILKDVPAVLQFGKMEQDFDVESDMMPYTFQVAGATKDDPATDVLAIFLEGDFPNYSKPGEGHTDEYNLWDSFLFPMIEEKFEASQDLEDFYRRLRMSSFEQAVMHTVSHRAVAVFVPVEGDIIPMGRNDLGAEYDWGTTSNTFGWGTQAKLVEAATKAVDAIKKPMGRLARAAMGSTATSSGTVEAPKEETPPGVHKTDTKAKPVNDPGKDSKDPWARWPGCSSKTHKLQPPPAGLQGNAKNRWIRTFLKLSPDAELPKDKDGKNFMLPIELDLVGFAQEQVSTNDDVKKLQDRVVRFRSSGETEDAQPVTPEEPGQVQKPKEKPSEQPADDKRPPADFLPEMSADDAKFATDFAVAVATNPKQPTALEVQRIESKWPKFSLGRGIKFSDMARWSIADIKHLAKKSPNAIALAFIEMRLRVGELGGFDPDVVTEKEDTKSPAPVGAPAKPGPVAAKGGRLARAKGGV